MSIVNAADFSYKLELTKTLQKDQEYHCDLSVDNDLDDFEVERYGHYVKRIDDDIENNLSLKCSTSFDVIKLKIYNKNKLVDTQTLTKKNNINYKLNYYELDIDIKDKYNDCTLNYDGIVKDYRIKQEKDIKKHFFKTFSVICLNETELIEIKVSNRQGKEIFYDFQANTNKMSYNAEKSISKDYSTSIYIYDEFQEKNSCILTLDGESKITKRFDSNVRLKDRFFESKVGKTINLICLNNINKILLFIDDRKWEKEIYRNEYNNTKSIKINIKDVINSIEDSKEEPKEIKIPIIKKTIIENKTIENKTIEDTIEVKIEDNLSDSENTSIEVEVIKRELPEKYRAKKSWFVKLWEWLF